MAWMTTMAAVAMGAVIVAAAPQLPGFPDEVRVTVARAGQQAALPQADVETVNAKGLRITVFGVSSDLLRVPGERAAIQMPDHAPVFTVHVPSSVRNDDVVLLKLKPKDGYRQVAVGGTAQVPYDSSAVVGVRIENVDAEGRTRRVTPKSTLKPGEYALVVLKRFFDFGVE